MENIRPGDLGACPPHSWWQKWICKTLGAFSFHWFMFIGKDEDEDGWLITESEGKGTALVYFYPQPIWIYRIKGFTSNRNTAKKIISIHAKYGWMPYDYDVILWAAIWWLVKHYFDKILPYVKDKEVNCQEWVCLLAKELTGKDIIPEGEPPQSVNLEHSPYLEYTGVMGD